MWLRVGAERRGNIVDNREGQRGATDNDGVPFMTAGYFPRFVIDASSRPNVTSVVTLTNGIP